MELGARPKVKPTPQVVSNNSCDNESCDSIDRLPDEIIEYILGLISPYDDLCNCGRVSSRWRDCVSRVISLRYHHFLGHTSHGALHWSHLPAPDSDVSNISKRYSHCAVYYPGRGCMYVFGGCTSTSSTFNDLWELNLSTRTWRRPLSMGAYPSPKACASMVRYEDTLVLFGGWTHPSLYPLHQSWKLFSELHIYHITENRWALVSTEQDVKPPAMAGHSATVHGDKMIVFGGLHKQRSVGHYSSSNDIWVYSLVSNVWERVLTGGSEAPLPRYGQSQIVLDDDYLLVLGGCGGPNNEYSDIWLLDMSRSPWSWVQMEVLGGEHRAKDIWCHPAVKVGQCVVVLGKCRNAVASSKQSQAQSSNSASSSQAWNVIPQLRRGINRGQGSIRHRVSAPAPHHRQDVSSSDSDVDLAVEPVHRADQQPNINLHINNLGRQEQQPTYRTSVNLNINPGPSSLPPSNPVNAPNALIPVKVTPAHSKQFGPAANTGNQDPSAAGPLARQLSAAAAGAASQLPGAPGNPETSKSAAAPMKNRQKMLENRQRQLASLQRMEEKIRNTSKAQSSSKHHKSSDSGAAAAVCPHHRMTTHILDISRAITDHVVTWIPVHPTLSTSAPQESILYSLVMGRTELIMFGGLQKDVSVNGGRSQNNSETVSNCLYFLNPPQISI